MLAKKYRLPVQTVVGKTGQSRKSSYFTLKIFPPRVERSRFGAVISAKVSKKAVERNRLKRQYFNFLQPLKESLPHHDYLLIFYPPAAALPKKEFFSELKKIFRS